MGYKNNNYVITGLDINNLENVYNALSPKSPKALLNEYIKWLNTHYYITSPDLGKKLKALPEHEIPTFSQCEYLLKYNYKLQSLKTICKHYKLKVSGNKNQLVSRVFTFLKLSNVIMHIQKRIRGYLHRKFLRMRGDAYKDRSLCVNDTDFLSGESLKDISCYQFISFRDDDGFVYGFDLVSLYNLILKSEGDVLNPYNRNKLPKDLYNKINKIIKLSNVLLIPLNLNIEEEEHNIADKSLDERVNDIFYKIDELGNYSDSTWLSSLSRTQYMRFIRELYDIWTYRAQLTIHSKRLICPQGSPFSNVHINYLQVEENTDIIKKAVIEVIELFIYSGIDESSQGLGAMYVLGALTLVNPIAAESLSWLYDSVKY